MVIVIVFVISFVVGMFADKVFEALKSAFRAPAIPHIGNHAYITPEGAEEDMLVGGDKNIPEGFSDNDRKKSFYTFLIIGMDEGVNTDTIMVASYDGIGKVANIISIPRDSLVNVSRQVKKINVAYPVGTLNGGGREGGVAQLRREVKTIIGFVPDFYISINLNAFVRIIDAAGGVEVEVPIRMIYDDPYQDLHIDIAPGKQLLDGKNALRFARYRIGNSDESTITDYQRMENQHAVVKALVTSLLKPAVILKIPEFIDIFTNNVRTDIPAEDMLWFASQLKEIRGANALSTYTMPTTGTSGLPMYYEYLDETAVVELINRTINPFTKEIEAKHLEIIGG